MSKKMKSIIETKEDFEKLSEKQLKVFERTKNKITKLFNKKNVMNKLNITEENFTKNNMVINSNNVIGMGYKSYYGFMLILEFINYIDSDERYHKKPELSYKSENENICNFNCDYLSKIFDVMKYDESIKLSVRDDYPIYIENKDLFFIVAPRGEDY